MLAIIGGITVGAAPFLLTKRCRACGRRNGLEREQCKYCHTAFPDEE
jgi:hypothetical protein